MNLNLYINKYSTKICLHIRCGSVKRTGGLGDLGMKMGLFLLSPCPQVSPSPSPLLSASKAPLLNHPEL